MHYVEVGLLQEVFQHSVMGIFDISGMRIAIAKGSIPHQRVQVDMSSLLGHTMANRDICMDRVNELSNESWLFDPGIILHCKDGTHCLIDGSHRLIRRAQEGRTTMNFFMVEEMDALRPDLNNYIDAFDWGKELKDGKLIPRH